MTSWVVPQMRGVVLDALNSVYDVVNLKWLEKKSDERQVEFFSWQTVDVIQNNELSPLSHCGQSI